MYFCIDGLRSTSLDKCLKSPVSGEPSTGDMVKWPKNC